MFYIHVQNEVRSCSTFEVAFLSRADSSFWRVYSFVEIRSGGRERSGKWCRKLAKIYPLMSNRWSFRQMAHQSFLKLRFAPREMWMERWEIALWITNCDFNFILNFKFVHVWLKWCVRWLCMIDKPEQARLN